MIAIRTAYPVILTPDAPGYIVYVPDLQINTEGSDIADALYMAADAISLCGIALQDMGKEVPPASSQLPKCGENKIASFVLVDFDAYRKANDKHSA